MEDEVVDQPFNSIEANTLEKIAIDWLSTLPHCANRQLGSSQESAQMVMALPDIEQIKLGAAILCHLRSCFEKVHQIATPFYEAPNVLTASFSPSLCLK